MSSLDYLADLVEKAAERGYVILREQCRHTTHTRAKNDEDKPRKGAARITIDEEKAIIAYADAGKEPKEIIALSGRGKTTVYRVLTKYGRL